VKAVHSTVDHFKQLSFPELSDGEKRNLKKYFKNFTFTQGVLIFCPLPKLDLDV